jgi:putative ABC transport system permease protein
MLKDLRFAVRMLLKQPGFTAIAVLTLALGIGATTAVFSLIQGVLLTPPPYRDPEQLAIIPADRIDGQPLNSPEWAAAHWTEWGRQAKSIEAVAGYGWTFNFMVRSDGSEALEGMWVTRDYFRVLGLQPLLGRTFSEAETTRGGPPVIIIGYDLWKQRFNGDPNIVGKTMRMSRRDTPPTIIAVMPPGIRFLPAPGASQEPNYNVNGMVSFWSPAVVDPKRLKDRQFNVVARIRYGTTMQQAQAELRAVTTRTAQTERDLDGFTPRLVPLTVEMNRDGRGILLPLLAAAALVLLIACGNVAALLLVRGLQRQQEYAVRSAMGMGRWGMLRQVSAEALLLAVMGGAFGAGLAVAVVRVLQAIGAHAIPRLDSVTTGWPVLAWGFGSATAAALMAAAIPALRASRLDPIEVLKSAGPKSSAGRGERRLLRAVTMVQTALTLALLVGSGLLIRTMINLAGVQSGYRTSHVLTATVTAVQGDWMAFHTQALERVSRVAGVQKAAFAWGVPLTGNDWPGAVEFEGQPPVEKASDRAQVPLRSVTPGYFDLMGQAISEGRDFRNTDINGAPNAAIVNQALVDRYFPHTNAIGKKIWGRGRNNPPVEVVGIVANSRTGDLAKAPEPEIYLCLWQARAFSKHLVVRTAADPRSVFTAIQRELRAVDPTAAIEHVKTMDQIRDESVASRTFAMQLLVGFAMVGSVLTLVGIYGVLALSVASRRREIAIRAAVGAEQRHIRKLVFAEGLRLIAGGVVLGVAAAVALSSVLRSFLFGVETTDAVTLAIVCALFGVVALGACWGPVRRAASVDPIEALRYE